MNMQFWHKMSKRKQIAMAGGGLLFLMIATAVLVETTKKTDPAPPEQEEKSSNSFDSGKQLAKNMATGEMILMAACLGKQGGIPRNKMGDYIAAAAAENGIPRKELFDNWDKYYSYAKEAEKRNRTNCLD